MMILRRLIFIAGALMLLALAAQNANGSTWTLSLDAQFLLLVFGAAGVAWGLGEQTPDANVGAQRAAPLPHVKHLLTSTAFLLTLLTLLAFVLRIWQLENSVHYFVDELNFVDGVLNTIDARQSGEALHLVHPFHWLAAFPRLFPYWQTLGTDIAGQTLTGLRLASAVLGALTIPAVYLLGKNMFDRRIGLLAALLLATFPPHIHFSRLGLNNVADPLFGTLAIAFLARALRERRRGDFALAGVMLGMTQYFYEGGRVVYPVAMLLWLGFSTFANRKTEQRVSWRAIGVFLLAAGLVMLPYYVMSFSYDLGLMPRLQSKSLPDYYWTMLLMSPAENGMLGAHLIYVLRTFAIYIVLPDQSFYYGGSVALILPYLVPSFLIGVIWSLLRGGRVLLLILFLAAMGNSLLRYSPWASGYVVTFPALCLLIALGLREIARWLQKLEVGARHALPLRNAAIALVCLMSLGQIYYYFGIHLDVFRQLRPMPDTHDAIFRSLEFPPDTYVHLIGDIVFYEFDIMRMQTYFERPDLCINVLRQVGVATEFTEPYVESLPRDADHAFFFQAGAEVEIAMLRRHFDVEGPFYSPYDGIPIQYQMEMYYAAVP